MATFLTAARIEAAITALAETRAKRTLLDFLVVKRTLTIKGEQAAISTGEPAFVQAAEELARVWSGGRVNQKADSEFFNIFSSRDRTGGYRQGKWISNGTNTTIGGNSWQSILSLSTGKPRRVTMQSEYHTHLSSVLLNSTPKLPLPSLSETAVWYFRRKNIDSIIGSVEDPAKRMELLEKQLVMDLGLQSADVGALFSTLGGRIEDVDLQSVEADPTHYLPRLGASKNTQVDSGRESQCSLDLVTALAAKPFVILTGTSGTGKSRATLSLAEQLQVLHSSNVDAQIFQIVPIGPDWTSPKRLIGYRTPFGQERKRPDGTITNESYEITESIRIILRACHPHATKVPHFLVFDEMNLSHVERYFAPFLSLMEASSILDDKEGAPIVDRHSLVVISELLTMENEDAPEAVSARLLVAHEQPLTLPPNIFYVGTVNIDETTYMFSPKVLDRAHVLEVRALRPSEYVAGPASEESIDASEANLMLQEAIDDRETGADSTSGVADALDPLLTEYNVDLAALEQAKELTLKTLDGCFKLLEPVGFEFAYRVIKEVYRYMYVWTRGQIARGATPDEAMDAWVSGLDRAVFQKILPKIHGNRATLGESLRALDAFLRGNNEASALPAKYALGVDCSVGIAPGEELNLPAGKTFTRSCSKLAEMNVRLQSRNHVTFVR